MDNKTIATSIVAKDTMNALSKDMHRMNIDAGWWTQEEKDALNVGGRITKQGALIAATKLALVHSEVSEALEGMRKGLRDDHLPHRPMFEVEIADVFIRLFDLAGAFKLDLGGAMQEKLLYNQQRADHKQEHRAEFGGKVI